MHHGTGVCFDSDDEFDADYGRMDTPLLSSSKLVERTVLDIVHPLKRRATKRNLFELEFNDDMEHDPDYFSATGGLNMAHTTTFRSGIDEDSGPFSWMRFIANGWAGHMITHGAKITRKQTTIVRSQNLRDVSYGDVGEWLKDPELCTISNLEEWCDGYEFSFVSFSFSSMFAANLCVYSFEWLQKRIFKMSVVLEYISMA